MDKPAAPQPSTQKQTSVRPRVLVVIAVGFITFQAAYFSWVDRSLYGVFGWIIPFGLTTLLFGRQFSLEPRLTREFVGQSLLVLSVTTTLSVVGFVFCERALKGPDEPTVEVAGPHGRTFTVLGPKATDRGRRATWIWLVSVAELIVAAIVRPTLLIWYYTSLMLFITCCGTALTFLQTLD